MTLNDRFSALVSAHPNWPPHLCLRAAVNAHRAALAAETAMRKHPDAFELIEAHLAQRENNHKRPEPQMPLPLAQASQESRGAHTHD